MMYMTITYNQNDAMILQPKFSMLQTHCTEIHTKKSACAIPGLVSRSFRFLSTAQANAIQSWFDKSPVWIKQELKLDEEVQPQVPISNCNGKLMGISCGYLTSNTKYLWNQQMQHSHKLQWNINIKRTYLGVSYKDRELVELRFTTDCLDKYFLISTANAGIRTIILPLVAAPRCYEIPQGRSAQPYGRKLTFGMIDAACLRDSSAICLQFNDERSINSCAMFLMNVLKLDCHQGPINCMRMSGQAPFFYDNSFDFWSNYAYQMIWTLGYRIIYRMTSNTLGKIRQLAYLSCNKNYSQHQCYLKLIAIYYRAKNNRFFDINEEFDKIPPIPTSFVLEKWEYVPRIYLTPYGTFPQPIKPMRGNRILRERQLFGPAEHFCRVIIRDVDLGQPQNDFMQSNEQWIMDLFLAKIPILVGNRQFEFLLCSNSQLRDRSFWFHAEYNGRRADNIRQWMGDFSSEKCIGTRIARMALSLTGTTATIRLSPDQMQLIDDKLDIHGRIFTDGVGKISRSALKEALTAYNVGLIEDDYMPCVIQARLNGIKGIFVLAPDLDHRGILIQYRPSQLKFKVDHNVLEIVKHSSSGGSYLNRQVITLLENMGVKKHIFLKLQNKTRMKISMSLLANQSAQRTLEQNVRSYDWERMYKSGIQLTKEPFARSLLLLLAQERLKKLRERSHVPISLSDGRMLLGVVDETDSLRYGQIFIQLRNLNGEREIIQNRKILITKNPAHFPGDIRILHAIDCPLLHHLYDCVVFPAHGERPHPNEISGSDLDGDEYWVCWSDDLVKNATRQHLPAAFDSAEKKKHPGKITMKEVGDFLYKYLSSDSLGALSNRHLACSELYGPSHENSCRLAQIISEAVDFPKTGVLPANPTDLKIDKYPDYMENKYKPSFESKSSIGTMYQQVKEVWKIHSEWQENLEDEHAMLDQNLVIKGYEIFMDDAEEHYHYYTSRLNTILSIYNLNNEYELITGCHSGPEEEKKNNDSIETALLEFRQLVQEMRKKFDVEKLSYQARLCKASAWYIVAYKAGSILSFGWIMDRLMSDIMKHNQIPQEEHQALKRIGQVISNYRIANVIKQLAAEHKIGNEEIENFSDSEKLAWQFLQIINYYSASVYEQDNAHRLLIFLHRIALDIL